MEHKQLLIDGARELGITLDGEAVERFALYSIELRRWSERINLTAIKDEQGIIADHFLDSLTVLPFVEDKGSEKSWSLLDIGSGAGFPGLPLKIVRPELRLTLMEGAGKKAVFLRHIVRALSIEGVRVIEGRAEDKETISEFGSEFGSVYGEGSGFDCIISRALTSAASFATLARPYLRPGGRLIAMKGPSGEALSSELNAVEGFTCFEHPIIGTVSGKGRTIVVMRPS